MLFELDRFELGADDRCEVHGRWFGVRGRRFMRPALTIVVDGAETRLLADLDDKPWAAEEGLPWNAAFASPPDGDLAGAELTVAPDITIALPAAARPRGARRPPRSRARTSAPSLTPIPAKPSLTAIPAKPAPTAIPAKPAPTAIPAKPAASAIPAVPAATELTTPPAPRREQPVGRADDGRLQQRISYLEAERTHTAARLSELTAEIAEVISERDATATERDAALEARDQAEKETESIKRKAKAAVRKAQDARDDAVSERDDAIAMRDLAREERDAAVADRDKAVEERTAAVTARQTAEAVATDAAAGREALTEANARMQKELGARATLRDIPPPPGFRHRRSAQLQEPGFRDRAIAALLLLAALAVVLLFLVPQL